MDLRKEILAVLDNPTNVWESIVSNFSSETRITLMILTTCETELDTVEWQAAVGRVSLEAAAKFEEALRVLDDVFVSINRNKAGKHVVAFRNPSMDDFCADHLDRHAGFAISVATQAPSLSQVKRLIELASAPSAGKSGALAHPNLHAALVADPSLLIDRLYQLLPDAPEPTSTFFVVALPLIQLLASILRAAL